MIFLNRNHARANKNNAFRMEVESSVRQRQITALKQALLSQWSSSSSHNFHPQPTAVLLFPASDLDCGQLQFPEKRWPLKHQAVLLVPVTDESELRVDSQQCYYVDAAQWDASDRINKSFRVIRVNQQQQSRQQDDDAMQVQEPLIAQPLSQTPRQLWLHQWVSSSSSVNYTPYLSALLDHLMMQLAPHNYLCTETKWRKFHRGQAFSDASQALSFLAAYTTVNRRAADALITHWIRMEVQQLDYAHVDVETFHANLLQHCDFCDERASHWQHGQWHRYLVGDRQFWHGDAPGCYSVCALWLLEEEFSAFDDTRPRRGLFQLTLYQLKTVLLPALYRVVLQDAAHWCAEQQSHIDDDDSPSLSTKRESLLQLAQLQLSPYSIGPLFRFSLAVKCWSGSSETPAQRRMPQYMEEVRRRAQQSSEKDMEWKGKLLATQGVDMEDLFSGKASTLLPPCLRRVFGHHGAVGGGGGEQSFKYEDRITVLTTMLDQGYRGRDRYVRAVCRKPADNTQEKRAVAARLYDDYMKKRGNKPRQTRRCDTVIDSVYQEGNRMRCFYEEALNGATRRRNHSQEEKDEMRRRCACELAGLDPEQQQQQQPKYALNSPMDYVSQRLARIANET